MQTKLTNRPVDQAISAIQALDLEAIRLRVMDAKLGEGWSRAHAENIELAYRNYLTMLVKHPDDAEDIVVSEDVDEFWHAHILHTMKYTEDCERVFGAYLHHNPHVGERTQADIEKKTALAEKTRRLYQQEFGASQTREAAWCAATVASAWCAATVNTEKAAWCAATVASAWCAATVNTEKAAWCAAAAAPAWCAAAVKTEKAAWCAAAAAPAWCAAAVKTEKAAWCAAAVKPENSAWCAAGRPAWKEARTLAQSTAFPSI